MKGTSALIKETEAWAERPLTPSLWPLPPHSRPPTPYWTPRQATAGTDEDDQAGWSGVRRGGFPQESAPHVPLSLLETPNSGHLGPLDKHQDEAQARPQLGGQPGSSPTPPPPLHCEFEPPGRFRGSPAKRGDKQGDSGSAQLALGHASISHVLFHPSSYEARLFVPVKQGGMWIP